MEKLEKNFFSKRLRSARLGRVKMTHTKIESQLKDLSFKKKFNEIERHLVSQSMDLL